jgi:hypothetical protein
MFTFSSGRTNAMPQLMEIEVQGQDGETIGTMDLFKMKELVYSGRLKGKESIRPLDGDWMPIGELLPLRDIFKMMGIDLVAVKVRAQRIKGWQTQVTSQPKQRKPKDEARQFVPPKSSSGTIDYKAKLVPLLVVVAAVAAAIWLFSG